MLGNNLILSYRCTYVQYIVLFIHEKNYVKIYNKVALIISEALWGREANLALLRTIKLLLLSKEKFGGRERSGSVFSHSYSNHNCKHYK